RMRATTTAISSLAVGIVGAGLGPTVVGVLSDRFAIGFFERADFFASCPGGRRADGMGTSLDVACVSASTMGLRYALISVLLAFAWAAAHYLLAARTLKHELYDPDQEMVLAPVDPPRT